VIGLSTKPFNINKEIYEEKCKDVKGFNYEICFMFIIAIPMYLSLIATAIYLIIVVKADNRSPWARENFDLTRTTAGFGFEI